MDDRRNGYEARFLSSYKAANLRRHVPNRKLHRLVRSLSLQRWGTKACEWPIDCTMPKYQRSIFDQLCMNELNAKLGNQRGKS